LLKDLKERAHEYYLVNFDSLTFLEVVPSGVAQFYFHPNPIKYMVPMHKVWATHIVTTSSEVYNIIPIHVEISPNIV
jgi:hypothetical protein